MQVEIMLANEDTAGRNDLCFFRAISGFEELRHYFGLGVNYGPSTVNRHRIEIYVLDAQGTLRASLTRLQWEVDELLAAVRSVGSSCR